MTEDVWVVVGCDTFDYRYYPVAIAGLEEALDIAEERSATASGTGSLRERFSVESPAAAMYLTGLSWAQIVTIVEAIS